MSKADEAFVNSVGTHVEVAKRFKDIVPEILGHIQDVDVDYIVNNFGLSLRYEEITSEEEEIKALSTYYETVSKNLRKLLLVIDRLKLSYIDASTSGYVYLMRENIKGLYKIGYSIDPEKRLSAINTLPYDVVELIHKIPTNNHERLEVDFHHWFSHTRVRGEWFELDEKDIEFIKSHERMYYYDTIRIDST